MESITYTHVQQLVEKLPETQLALAYHLLLELVEKEVDPQSPQAEFMKLSVEEQQILLSQQAEQMKTHYEQIADERAEWQAGDFIDECETRGNNELACVLLPNAEIMSN